MGGGGGGGSSSSSMGGGGAGTASGAGTAGADGVVLSIVGASTTHDALMEAHAADRRRELSSFLARPPRPRPDGRRPPSRFTAGPSLEAETVAEGGGLERSAVVAASPLPSVAAAAATTDAGVAPETASPRVSPFQRARRRLSMALADGPGPSELADDQDSMRI